MSFDSDRIVDLIDRSSLTQRPLRRHVMYQEWRHLTFLHWEVPVELLRPLVPRALELDLYQGRAFIGLVPFTMCGVRPIGVPSIPLFSRFHETNVRTYVHFQGRDPGVWFFSLDAANPLAVVLARAWYRLPYFHARMSLIRSGFQTEGSGEVVTYSSRRLRSGSSPAECRVSCRPGGPIAPAEPGTLEHFLAERYLLYTEYRGRLLSGRVFHTPYPLQSAEVLDLEETLLSVAGLPRPDHAPLAHFSPGVRVRVYPLTPVP